MTTKMKACLYVLTVGIATSLLTRDCATSFWSRPNNHAQVIVQKHARCCSLALVFYIDSLASFYLLECSISSRLVSSSLASRFRWSISIHCIALYLALFCLWLCSRLRLCLCLSQSSIFLLSLCSAMYAVLVLVLHFPLLLMCQLNARALSSSTNAPSRDAPLLVLLLAFLLNCRPRNGLPVVN